MSPGRAAAVVVAGALAIHACSPESREFEERGDRYSAVGEYHDARVEYGLALEEAGASAPPELRLKAAELTLQSKDFTRANRMFEALAEQDPEREAAARALYALHARRWAALGDTFAAMRAIDWLVERDSSASLGDLHFTVADVAYARPDYDAAIASYLLGLARAPEAATPSTFARLGDAYERRGNCPAAITAFRRYLASGSVDPTLGTDARYRMGACALKLAERAFANGDLAGAVVYLRQVQEIGEPAGQLGAVDLLLGRVEERSGRREEAMAHYRRAVERDEELQTRSAVEAYRRLKQLEFGFPLQDEEGADGERTDGGPAPGRG